MADPDRPISSDSSIPAEPARRISARLFLGLNEKRKRTIQSNHARMIEVRNHSLGDILRDHVDMLHVCVRVCVSDSTFGGGDTRLFLRGEVSRSVLVSLDTSGIIGSERSMSTSSALP